MNDRADNQPLLAAEPWSPADDGYLHSDRRISQPVENTPPAPPANSDSCTDSSTVESRRLDETDSEQPHQLEESDGVDESGAAAIAGETANATNSTPVQKTGAENNDSAETTTSSERDGNEKTAAVTTLEIESVIETSAEVDERGTNSKNSPVSSSCAATSDEAAAHATLDEVIQVEAQGNLKSSAADEVASDAADITPADGVATKTAPRRGKAPRRSTPDANGATENGKKEKVTVDVSSLQAGTADHAAGESKHAEEPGDNSSVDDRPRSHGKEPSVRVVQRPPTADVPNASTGVAASEAAASGNSAAPASDDANPSAVLGAGDRVEGLHTQLTRGQRGQAVGTSENKESPQLNRVDTARFVGRVARAFHFAQERGGTLQLRLSPPELGSLRLELTVKEGALAATLETETPAARRLLLDHLPALRERLAEQNVRVERFDVDVRRDDQGGRGGQSATTSQQQAQQEQQSQQPTLHRQRAPKPAVAESANVAAVAPAVVSSTGINLVV